MRGKAWAVVPAAGEGTRLGPGIVKVLRPVGGVPMLARTLVALCEAPSIDRIVVAAGDPDPVREIGEEFAPGRVEVVAGGPTRRDSVRAALDHVPAGVGMVVVHDAARPLVTAALVEAALAAVDGAAGAVCAIRVADTLKRAGDGRIVATVPRSGLWRAQTPQAFRTDVLRHAHDRALPEGLEATDDAMLVEALGEHVAIVPGDEFNLKITTPADLALAEAVLAARERQEAAR